MGREETVRYVCDWCVGTSPPGPLTNGDYGTDMPKNWGYIDSTQEILCAECHVARQVAIDAAREARRAAVHPVPAAKADK